MEPSPDMWDGTGPDTGYTPGMLFLDLHHKECQQQLRNDALGRQYGRHSHTTFNIVNALMLCGHTCVSLYLQAATCSLLTSTRPSSDVSWRRMEFCFALLLAVNAELTKDQRQDEDEKEMTKRGTLVRGRPTRRHTRHKRTQETSAGGRSHSVCTAVVDAEEVKEKMEKFSTFQLPFSQEKMEFVLETAKDNIRSNRDALLREVHKAVAHRHQRWARRMGVSWRLRDFKSNMFTLLLPPGSLCCSR